MAAIVAGAQILGGLVAPWIRHRFKRRTSALLTTAALSALTLAATGLVESFAAVLGLIVVWGLLFAATRPIRQAYLNGLIPSRQRATILSFDSLAMSSGGVWAQPLLGRAADLWGYAPTYLISAGISAIGIPFLYLSRRQNAPADTLAHGAVPDEAEQVTASAGVNQAARPSGATRRRSGAAASAGGSGARGPPPARGWSA